ncbi:MAG: DUF302 domain-containing protein [Pseudomonadota bacterium]
MIRTAALSITAATLAACATAQSTTLPAPASIAATPEQHTVYISDDAFAVVEARLRDAIADRPLTLFTVVDHGEGARSVNMPIGQSKLFLVGNPRIGTAFMRADPQMGLHLPLKILIHDAPDGTTHLAYSHPGEAAQTHGVSAQLVPQIARIHDTMEDLLSEAAGDTVRTINAR